MITRIALRGFKAVRGQQESQLFPFSTLIGRNGSGKSSILEALEWLAIAINAGAEAATEKFVRTDDLTNRSNDCKSEFSIDLSIDPGDASVGERIDYSIRVGSNPVTGTPTVIFEELVVVRGEDKEKVIQTIDGSRRYFLDLTNDAAPENVRASRRRRRLYESKSGEITLSESRDVSSGWVRISEADRLVISEIDPLHSRAAELVRRTLEPAVFLRLNPRAIGGFSSNRSRTSAVLLDEQGERLATLLTELDVETRAILAEKLAFIIAGTVGVEAHIPSGPADRRYFQLQEELPGSGRVDIPSWMLSEGTRRITAILAVLLHPNAPTLLCIEELENGIDPWTLKFVVDELAGAVERGTQVIITTHSPYLLDLVPIENVILCERGAFGATFTSGLNQRASDELRSQLGLGELYTSRFLFEGSGKSR